MNWISVKDGVPPDSRRVLICDKYSNPCIGFYDNNLGLWCDMSWSEFPELYITHWIAIPAVPNENQGEIENAHEKR